MKNESEATRHYYSEFDEQGKEHGFYILKSKDTFAKTIKLKLTARNLIDFLTCVMERHIVHNNNKTRQEMIDIYKSIGIKKGHEILKESFTELVKVGLLIKLQRGKYQVNKQLFKKVIIK
jgi:hypothetical protein